jgi:hypothetical protein
MDTIEQAARDAGRTLLVLDTIAGDTAEGIYRRRGYTEVGKVPGYTRDSGGRIGDTVIFYRSI